MSQRLISLSPDLKRLRDEGYDVEVRSGYLLVKDVPYVNAKKEVRRAVLVSDLSLAGDVTTKPGTHVAMFTGDYPCKKDGSRIDAIRHQSTAKEIFPDVVVQHSFSSKPPRGSYSDYFEKMTTYAAIISGPAHSIDPSATPKTFPTVMADDDQSVFHYVDTASSRADIVPVTKKLEGHSVAIVGLGGTGSYVLDLVAKTPVKAIHLFDRDDFSQHNAFRAPGAPSAEDLRKKPKKVAYLAELYSKMRRNIVFTEVLIDASNVDMLQEMDFVFLCVDGGKDKMVLVEKLEAWGKPFIDVGMGVESVDGALRGVLRVTTSTSGMRRHVWDRKRIPFSDGNHDDGYSHNIQIVELNALNAALAVIKWKKMLGFYADLDHEHNCLYTIDGNVLTNEDKREEQNNNQT